MTICIGTGDGLHRFDGGDECKVCGEGVLLSERCTCGHEAADHEGTSFCMGEHPDGRECECTVFIPDEEELRNV